MSAHTLKLGRFGTGIPYASRTALPLIRASRPGAVACGPRCSDGPPGGSPILEQEEREQLVRFFDRLRQAATGGES